MTNEPKSAARAARRNSLWLAAVVLAMFGFGFAMGPLYDAICRVTGFNGKTSGMAAAEPAAPAIDTTRKVKVQFLTTVNGSLPWIFRAEQTEIEVHPGEFATVKFYARNTESRDVVAQAVPNVAPWDAARHLRKSECFCFNNQPFKAGEEKEMPVRFVLDPELPADVDTVTLSYTFFDVTQTAKAAAAPNS